MNFNVNRQKQMLGGELNSDISEINTENDPKSDIELKLEIDKLNDIKNVMYLKSKIVLNGELRHNLIISDLDERHKLTLRNDFKKLMQEKNQAQMLEEQQRAEMERMAKELEKKVVNSNIDKTLYR